MNYAKTAGTTSILVIGASLTTLFATTAAIAWEVAGPILCLVSGVVTTMV